MHIQRSLIPSFAGEETEPWLLPESMHKTMGGNSENTQWFAIKAACHPFIKLWKSPFPLFSYPNSSHEYLIQKHILKSSKITLQILQLIPGIVILLACWNWGLGNACKGIRQPHRNHTRKAFPLSLLFPESCKLTLS